MAYAGSVLPLVPLLRLFGISLAILGTGCMGTSIATRGYPLYAAPGGRLPVNQVATLNAVLPVGGAPGGGTSSFIKMVDGRDVSGLDSIFELAPGCHVVEPDRQLTLSNGSITMSGSLGAAAFPFPMRAGYAYSVVVELQESMGGGGRIQLFGMELDAGGKRTKTFPPIPPAIAARVCKSLETRTN